MPRCGLRQGLSQKDGGIGFQPVSNRKGSSTPRDPLKATNNRACPSGCERLSEDYRKSVRSLPKELSHGIQSPGARRPLALKGDRNSVECVGDCPQSLPHPPRSLAPAHKDALLLTTPACHAFRMIGVGSPAFRGIGDSPHWWHRLPACDYGWGR
jgi:hypothetical protein